MFNEIGSNYYINSLDKISGMKEIELIEDDKHVFLDTARSAIRLALNNISIERRVAILPMFTCDTVIQPFIEHGYKIYYYDVDLHFNVDRVKFERLVNQVKPSVIFVHAYFGFDTLKNVRKYLESLRQRKIYVIEDLTQSLFSFNDYDYADFYVGSIRKWVAIPDGGFLISQNIGIKWRNLLPNLPYFKKQLKALLLKGRYVQNPDPTLKEEYNNIFSDAKDIIDSQTQVFAMSDLSKKLLQTEEIEEIKNKRKTNFKYLLKYLKDEKSILIPRDVISENEVPLYFPIYINDRLKFQRFMASNNIYLPIIWPKSDLCSISVDDKSSFIYEKIICIPCDQRYGENDMKRIVMMMKKYLGGL